MTIMFKFDRKKRRWVTGWDARYTEEKKKEGIDLEGGGGWKWKNSRHATRLVFPRNFVRGTSAEISYWWWRITTQIRFWLDEGKFQPTNNQKYYTDLGSDTWLIWSLCVRSSDVISRGKLVVASRNMAIFSGQWKKCLFNYQTFSFQVTGTWQYLTQSVATYSISYCALVFHGLSRQLYGTMTRLWWLTATDFSCLVSSS